MSNITSVEIELEDHFHPNVLAQVERSYSGQARKDLLRIVQAILLARRGEYFEKIDPNFEMEIKTYHSKLTVILHGVPEDKLYLGKLVKQKEKQIICGIRDVLISRIEGMHSQDHDEIVKYIFSYVRNASVLTPEDKKRNPYGRIMIQGGHHIAKVESHHHKRLGFALGLYGLEMVTGSGPGSMEDPFKGALRAYQMNDIKRKFIGITEDGIISGEPCNDYIDHLIIFPDIEKRLEAFVRMTRGGIVVPGGPGTLEEILTILWIKNLPSNKDFEFPLYFCQPVQSGDYFKNILSFLKTCFNEDFVASGQIKLFISESEEKIDPNKDPKRIAKELHSDLVEAQKKNEKWASKRGSDFIPLWNWEINFPAQLQEPLIITKKFVESLRFEKGMPRDELFFSLRSLCSALVETNVRDREFIKNNGYFELHGDPEILNGLDKLFQSFARDQRMGGREYICPYVVKK